MPPFYPSGDILLMHHFIKVFYYREINVFIVKQLLCIQPCQVTRLEERKAQLCTIPTMIQHMYCLPRHQYGPNIFEGPALDSSNFHKTFRRRFKMSYAQYLEIVEKCKSCEQFQCWSDPDTPGNNAAPLELLVLASLKRLGKGWSFDELSENTLISCEVKRTFFNTFIEFSELKKSYP